MIKKKKSNKVYSQEVIDTQHVFTKDAQVYIKDKDSNINSRKEVWSPINFKWVLIGKVQDCLVLE
ncbi:hypothetical protein [Maribacter ulvicola]|uniref:Uncharacterized protein n=1 Tax=Maribacter ulvicola TaxID=228959 RepID=A0A1N6YSS3_9FLAO|nr:hypothetical protein [Maribacter ulvicola]SIR17650.1 hypothetical protein SAMN05421797_107129 [Maribacter ulvicola]